MSTNQHLRIKALTEGAMLVALALEGDEDRAGYNTVRGTAKVDADTGLNTFEQDPAGPHAYVVRKFEAEWYKNKINGMIR